MADPTIFQSSASALALFVELRWGDPNAGITGIDRPESGSARYTTWHAPVIADGATTRYEPLAGLRYEPSRQTGAVEDEPFELSLPRGVEPLRSVVRKGHPPIEVIVRRGDPADESTWRIQARGHFVERDWIVGADPRATVRIRCSSVKSMLDIPLCVLAEPDCQWALASTSCGIPIEDVTVAGVLTAIEGRTVAVDVLSTQPELRGIVMPVGWARFGRLRKNGLVFDILDHDHASGTALLSGEPPERWLQQYVGVTAGCPRDKPSCVGRFNNLSRFSGYGVAIPDYNPGFSGGSR
ncbi:MAG: hypothetical protein KF684_04065 [Phycisphaeraceae bacterium]|nr:hypothetical protein [Phycisphaeraceae bacterium]